MTTYATDAGPRIETTRRYPWKQSELPAGAVYTLDEDVDAASVPGPGPVVLKRTVPVIVEFAHEAVAGIDDLLDRIALQAERAVDVDVTFGGVCDWATLQHTNVDVLTDGDKQIALLKLIFSVTYHTEHPYPADVTIHPRQAIRAAFRDRLISATSTVIDSLQTIETTFEPVDPPQGGTFDLGFADPGTFDTSVVVEDTLKLEGS